MKLELPWPPRELNPNFKCHQMKKYRIGKKYKEDCFYLAKAAGLKFPGETSILIMTFCPPDKRRRDDDNLVSASKWLRDGIAMAMGVDDSKVVGRPQWGKPVLGGKVVVELVTRVEAA